MSSSGASARRATFDAIALALSFLAVDAIIVTAVLADLVDPAQGIVTILALAAVVLLLFRDDVAEAIATGNENLGLAVDDEPVRRALDSLAGQDEWTATDGGLRYSRELIEMISADYDFAIGAASFTVLSQCSSVST